MLFRRSLAWILDAIVISALVFAAAWGAGAVLGPVIRFHPHAAQLSDTTSVDAGAFAVYALLGTAISAAYVAIPLSKLRASPAQLLLRLRVVDADDASALSLRRALGRWLLLFPPFATLAALAGPAPVLATAIWLAAVAWYLVLLVTTARSGTSRGLHDRLTGNVVARVR
jgi:hypothetical protein